MAVVLGELLAACLNRPMGASVSYEEALKMAPTTVHGAVMHAVRSIRLVTAAKSRAALAGRLAD
jgi:hypothetical protein